MRTRWLISAATLTVGYAAAAGCFWLLLQIPESSIGALAASVLLAIAVVVLAGATTATAVAVWRGTAPARTIRSIGQSLPFFIIGLLVFAGLWWLTGAATSWWAVHRGEVDAVALSYLRTDRTAAAHAMVNWLLWLLPWGPGLSLLGGLTAASQLPTSFAARLRAGLRTGLSPVPVLTVTIAVLVFTQGVWRLAYWRPEALPPSSGEVVFVAVKLTAIYGAFVALVASALATLARAAGITSATAAAAVEGS